MAKLLFHLNGVPEEEADDIRTLLEQHGIAFYETNAGRWGISVAAIWIPDEAAFEQARKVIDGYQNQRSDNLDDGPIETLGQRWKRRPIDLILVIFGIAIVLGLSVWPFISAFQ